MNSFYKYLFFSALLLFIISFSAHAQSGPVYLKGGWYFNTATQKMIKNEGILVRGGRFYQVGGQPSAANHSDYKTIKLEDDEYVLPGIVDIHAHYRIDAFGSKDLRSIDEFKYNAMIYLANGVTSTWSAGVYYPYMELATKHLIDSGQWVGPHLWASGPYFGTARHGWNRDTKITKDGIYRQVDYWAKMGVTAFKAKGLGPEAMKYLVNRAHWHGIPVAGHLDSGFHNTTNSIDAIDSGIDRVEHILGGFVLDRGQYAYPVWNKVDTTSTAFRKTMQYFLDHHVYFDATLNAPVYFTTLKKGFDYWQDEQSLFTPYVRNMLPPRSKHKANELMDGLYRAMGRTTKAFYDAGGGDLITLGTDAPTHGYFLAGFGSHREMDRMAMIGIPEAAVLKIASQNSANAIGKGSLLGSIETGKLADLYVVKGNPLIDINNTRNIQMVMKAGKVYDPQKLLEQVKGKIGPSDSTEADTWFKYPILIKRAEALKEGSKTDPDYQYLPEVY